MILLNLYKIAILIIFSAITYVYTKSANHNYDSLDDFLTDTINRGLAAQSLKLKLSEDLEFANLISNLLPSMKQQQQHLLEQDQNENIIVNKKRFYRWPNAATRTRVKLLAQHPASSNNDDISNLAASSQAEYYRRKQLEKNMIEKNRMYQYFHG